MPNEADYNTWLGAGSGEGSMAEQERVLVQPVGLRHLPPERDQQAERAMPET